MKKLVPFLLIGLILVSLVFSVGCTSITPDEQPTMVVQTTQSKIVTSTSQTLEKKCIISEPQVQKCLIGETATDGKLKVTVNSRSFTDIAGDPTVTPGYPYPAVTPDAGYHYLVLDITIENLQSVESHSFSYLTQFLVKDSHKSVYTYEADQEATGAANSVAVNSFWTVEGRIIPPGEKRRGKILFEVPIRDTFGYFCFKFNYNPGDTAVYTF
jgi:hypothetical protein